MATNPTHGSQERKRIVLQPAPLAAHQLLNNRVFNGKRIVIRDKKSFSSANLFANNASTADRVNTGTSSTNITSSRHVANSANGGSAANVAVNTRGEHAVNFQNSSNGFQGINYNKIRQLVSPKEEQPKKAQDLKPPGSSGIQNSSGQTEYFDQQVYEAHQEAIQQARERAKVCLSCEGMKDFVGTLQSEIKRLETITNNLQSQLVAAGATPEVPDHLKPNRKQAGVNGGMAFRNVCPSCTTFKALQRPNSGGREVRQPRSDFRIRSKVGGGLSSITTNKALPMNMINKANLPTLPHPSSGNDDLMDLQTSSQNLNRGRLQSIGATFKRKRQF